MRNAIRSALNFVRGIKLSDRQAIGLFVLSIATFIVFSALWLSVSTNTALSNRDLDRLTTRDKELQQQINETWTAIGNATAAERMEARAKQLGFTTPLRVEHLVAAQAGQALTTTVVTTATLTR